jgi:CheY-like chemotaxis protein
VSHTLLLADDSVTIQRVIELTFADEDVQVIAVSDGDQAIQRLNSAAPPPDIVLADIGMPGKNGYEVAQHIRQTPRLAHIPVVLLTGAFEPVDQARATEAGCDGVLAKPFEPQLVIGRVKELLARPRRVPAPADARPDPPSQQPLLGNHAFNAHGSGPAQQAPVAPGELNDYFDRLDAAFSSLSPAPPPPTSSPAPAQPSMTSPPAPAAPLEVNEIDWFGFAPGGPATEPWDLPAPEPVHGPPDPPLSREFLAPLDASFTPAPSGAPVAPEVPVPPPAPVAPAESLPPLAPVAPVAVVAAGASVEPAPSDTSYAPPAPATAPATATAPARLPPLADAFAALLAAEQSDALTAMTPVWPGTLQPAPAVTDEIIEAITRRVLDRLSDTVVRDTVADIVSKVAEQLVREEIERIKASIK